MYFLPRAAQGEGRHVSDQQAADYGRANNAVVTELVITLAKMPFNEFFPYAVDE